MKKELFMNGVGILKIDNDNFYIVDDNDEFYVKVNKTALIEELIKITTDKKEQKRLKERFRRLTKKLEKEEL